MHHSQSRLRNFLLGRARRAPALADPADMGTCFGLEMTLDQPLATAPEGRAASLPWWRWLPLRKTPAA